MGAKKNFVLDTNVILHDYKCIENFQENDIYLPIVVLEELDKFKKGSEQINYNAREFVRELDLLTSNDLFLKGSPYLVLCVDDRREESEDQDNLGQQGCEPSYEGSFFGYSR